MKIGIIIVNWNGLKFLEPCLEQLGKQTFQDFETYIVDNASTDGSREFLAKHYPKLPLIKNERNLGFAEPNNQAIREALKDPEITHLLALNNDTLLEPDFLEQLAKAAKGAPDDVGAWQGRVLVADEPRLFDSAGLEIYRNLNAAQIGVGEIDDGQYKAGEIYGVNAAAGLYRRELVEQLSYNGQFFDSDFFAYLEDVDVALRSRAAGWKAMLVPAAKIRHIGSATGGRDSPFQWGLHSRNRMYLIYKNLRWGEIWRQLPAIMESDLRFTVGFALRGQWPVFWSIMRGRWRGLWTARRLMGAKRAHTLAQRHTRRSLWAPDRPLVAPASGHTKLSVVIPNWNGRDMIGACLDSLRKQTLKHIQVIVVENGSVDGSAEYIREHYPEVVVVQLARNNGFAGGVNKGIKASTGTYIALLNNDAVAEPAWAEELVRAMEVADIAMAKIVRLDDPSKLDSIGDEMSVWGLPTPGGRNLDDRDFGDAYPEIFAASGGASVYKREVFERVGWFDPEFFAYYEDVDVSFRARLAGYEIVLAPKAMVRHAIGATSSKLKHFQRYHLLKNANYLYYKNMPGWLFWKYLPRFLLVQGLLFGAALKHGAAGIAFKAYGRFALNLPFTLYKRVKVQEKRRVQAREIERLLSRKWPLGRFK